MSPDSIDSYDIEDQRRWSDKTYGKGKRLGGVLAHIRKELVEIKAEPGDASEWADLLILAIDGATRQGLTGAEVIAAYHAKIRENRAREWPPIPEGGFPEDVAVEHVRPLVTWNGEVPATDHVHTTIHEYKDGVHTEIHESRPVLDVQVSRNISPLEEDEIRRLGGGCR